jgi:hypothetical protein
MMTIFTVAFREYCGIRNEYSGNISWRENSILDGIGLDISMYINVDS